MLQFKLTTKSHISSISSQMHVIAIHSQKKRYKSCHWGCTFSKGKLLSIFGANMYILGANMYILGANVYILGANMYVLSNT